MVVPGVLVGVVELGLLRSRLLVAIDMVDLLDPQVWCEGFAFSFTVPGIVRVNLGQKVLNTLACEVEDILVLRAHTEVNWLLRLHPLNPLPEPTPLSSQSEFQKIRLAGMEVGEIFLADANA